MMMAWRIRWISGAVDGCGGELAHAVTARSTLEALKKIDFDLDLPGHGDSPRQPKGAGSAAIKSPW